MTSMNDEAAEDPFGNCTLYAIFEYIRLNAPRVVRTFFSLSSPTQPRHQQTLFNSTANTLQTYI